MPRLYPCIYASKGRKIHFEFLPNTNLFQELTENIVILYLIRFINTEEQLFEAKLQSNLIYQTIIMDKPNVTYQSV